MLSNVSAKHKWGNDTAEYAVALLSAVAEGWVPPETLTQDEYYAIKGNPDKYNAALVGFAAYCCSYGGKFWGGYARGNLNDGTPRDHSNEASRHMIKQGKSLKDVKFTCMSYTEMDIPDGSTVYCDPPYASTTGYSAAGDFNNEEFWEWASALSKRCRVFVSEYSAPIEWGSIWEKRVNSYVSKNNGKYNKATEKLFIIAGGLGHQTTQGDLFA